MLYKLTKAFQSTLIKYYLFILFVGTCFFLSCVTMMVFFTANSANGVVSYYTYLIAFKAYKVYLSDNYALGKLIRN